MNPGTRENLVELDCLRGIAILLVLLHHADGMLTPHLGRSGIEMSPLRAFIGGGQTGVSLFFVLSAFCLSLPIFRPAGVRRFDVAEFFRRRALRILPLYWSVVVGSALLTGTALEQAIPYLVFAQSAPGFVAPIPGFSAVWWSLATEVQFYLLLPILPLFLASRRSRWIGLAGIAAYVASYAFYVSGSFPAGSVVGELAISYSVYGRGPHFLLGIAAAWTYARYGAAISSWARKHTALRCGASDAILFACLYALGSLLSWVVSVGYYKAAVPPLAVWNVAEAVAWSAVVVVMLVLPVRSKRLFVNAALAAVGRWSYSIYLLHLAVLGWVIFPLRQAGSQRFRSWDLETGVVVLAATAACIALSAMTYQLIEKPFLRKKYRSGMATGAELLSRERA